MPQVGDPAPDFTGVTEDGEAFTFSSLRGKPVALFFFPKANTTGCTMETRAFADRYDELRAAGWSVVGVSVDSVPTQKGFAAKCHAGFHLVSDSSKSIARAYDVLGFLGFARRVTFLVSAEGRIDEVISAMTPMVHVTRTLARAMGGAAE